jgi:mono/diheme cytochrome c family protein
MLNPIHTTFLLFVSLSVSAAWGETGSVSFTKEVAPILAAKCGKCHISNAKGRYGIESYDALIESDSIVAQDPEASNFIAVIESGEMPKGGLKVSNGELKTLKKWVAEGAKFDGDNQKKPLIKPVAKDARQSNGTRQRGRSGSGGSRLRAVEKNPQAVGEAGVDWYVTWETGLAEAKRSNRPIFFMSAATQCSGISGVF